MISTIYGGGGSALARIIENLKTKLLDEACRQIDTIGFSAMTMQSVSKACGVAVGTVYNYYPSKDHILAAYLEKKWSKCLDTIYVVSRYSYTHDAVIRCIYDQIKLLEGNHTFLLMDENARQVMDAQFQGLLCHQLAKPLRKFTTGDIEAEIIAEALLIWIRRGKSFDDIQKNISKLIEYE